MNRLCKIPPQWIFSARPNLTDQKPAGVLFPPVELQCFFPHRSTGNSVCLPLPVPSVSPPWSVLGTNTKHRKPKTILCDPGLPFVPCKPWKLWLWQLLFQVLSGCCRATDPKGYKGVRKASRNLPGESNEQPRDGKTRRELDSNAMRVHPCWHFLPGHTGICSKEHQRQRGLDGDLWETWVACPGTLENRYLQILHSSS